MTLPATPASTPANTAKPTDPAEDGEIYYDEVKPWIPVILSPRTLIPTSAAALSAAVVIGLLSANRGVIIAASLAVLAGSLVFLAVIDAHTQRLPNPLVFSLYGAMSLGIVLGIFTGEVGPGEALMALACMVGAFAFWWMAAFALGGVGFGDIKLAGAMGLGLGLIGPWTTGLGTVAIPVIIGGVISIILLTIGKRNMGIPFGPFLALGAIIAMAAPGQFSAGLL